ncbi:hypothetical protein [Armatimonas sp.]|uniref:hypothetical protein n=1 Tax=Armatimonas sp. TaxID=1872638 RepID=UPI00374D8B3C
MTLSETLSAHEKPIREWLDAAKKHVAAVQKLQKATEDGIVRDLEKLRLSAQASAETLAERASACPEFDFDANAYLQSDGEFLSELLAEAERIGLTVYERDGTIFSYPVLVRREPDLAAIRVDKALHFTLRPSVLAAALKKIQAREAKARPERFIETLFTAYELLRAKENLASWIDLPLSQVYDILTLLPGSEKEYTLLDFTRDVYFLDTSGITETKKGYELSLPASTASRERKAKLLPFVDRQGREKLYATVKFTPPGD